MSILRLQLLVIIAYHVYESNCSVLCPCCDGGRQICLSISFHWSGDHSPSRLQGCTVRFVAVALTFSKRQLWALLLALDRPPAVYAVQMKDESCTRVTPELTGADSALLVLRADPALALRELVYHLQTSHMV
jgi:hypothetical protein